MSQSSPCRRAPLLLGVCLLSAACGSSPAPPSDGIPDPGPGNEVDDDFDSVSPNDTPDQATPLGTSTTADVVVWIVSNDIGGSAGPANYFVFRSGPAAGQFAFDGCFEPPVTSLTAGLWQVVDAQQKLPPVATWTSAADGCLSNATAPIEASTVYLFGVTATGGAGSYSL
jgi:hypothetical protein